MKHNCSKTLDYAHEKKRMCDYYEICENGCPLLGAKGCRTIDYITQEHIDIVQKWSNKHPEKHERRRRRK